MSEVDDRMTLDKNVRYWGVRYIRAVENKLMLQNMTGMESLAYKDAILDTAYCRREVLDAHERSRRQ